MAANDFLSEAAREKTSVLVREIEQKTSAELVVAVRPRSANYRHADLLAGALFAFLALLAILYLPHPIAVATIPLDLALAFAAGVGTSAVLPPVRRFFSGRALAHEAVVSGAARTFLEQRIGATRSRLGLLVYLSVFEGRVALVPDTGLEIDAAGHVLDDARQALEAAAARRSVPAFLSALAQLGEVLRDIHPIRDGDVNELPDLPSVM